MKPHSRPARYLYIEYRWPQAGTRADEAVRLLRSIDRYSFLGIDPPRRPPRPHGHIAIRHTEATRARQ